MLQPQRYTMSDIVHLSRTITKEEEEILLAPYNYILRIPGKEIRIKLAKAFNYWLKIPQDDLNAVIDIVDLLHVGSLLLDDIEDNSVLRRGIPVAHNVYGIPYTLNSLNYILPLGFKKAIELRHPKGARICAEEWMNLSIGQGMDIYWRDNYICPSETAYKVGAMRKTGGFFSLIVRLMQLFSDYEKNFTNLIGILAVYYQIRDDYCNLYLDEYAQNKGYCEDLTEGKFSFPIIHAIQTSLRSKEIENILRQRTKDIEVKRYCVSLLKESGSHAYTKTVLEELDKDAREEIDRLGGNPLLLQILDNLLNWKFQSK
ncbi:terpene synthase-like [Xylocopa sonorina]|uniref:terpene synthase-like n=1 Tax=Xylocopa sonorina TaxID=1818115 RepID=UPI00403A9CEF